jgi:NADH:ubiquinone oxidoreductase subunit 6 (subunit J)
MAVDYFVALMVIMGAASALLVAFHPNILYAAVSLIFSLLSVAGLYGALGADFLAAAQLIIYVGGIIVVILFAVMMSENIYRSKFIDNSGSFIFPFIFSCVILAGLWKLIDSTKWPRVESIDRSAVSTVESLGRALVGPYALVFQYVAIVLLAGLIGAVVVARPHHHQEDGKGHT